MSMIVIGITSPIGRITFKKIISLLMLSSMIFKSNWLLNYYYNVRHIYG